VFPAVVGWRMRWQSAAALASPRATRESFVARRCSYGRQSAASSRSQKASFGSIPAGR
jgi:hypothetical protein